MGIYIYICNQHLLIIIVIKSLIFYTILNRWSNKKQNKVSNKNISEKQNYNKSDQNQSKFSDRNFNDDKCDQKIVNDLNNIDLHDTHKSINDDGEGFVVNY